MFNLSEKFRITFEILQHFNRTENCTNCKEKKNDLRKEEKNLFLVDFVWLPKQSESSKEFRFDQPARKKWATHSSPANEITWMLSIYSRRFILTHLCHRIIVKRTVIRKFIIKYKFMAWILQCDALPNIQLINWTNNTCSRIYFERLSDVPIQNWPVTNHLALTRVNRAWSSEGFRTSQSEQVHTLSENVTSDASNSLSIYLINIFLWNCIKRINFGTNVQPIAHSCALSRETTTTE